MYKHMAYIHYMYALKQLVAFGFMFLCECSILYFENIYICYVTFICK